MKLNTIKGAKDAQQVLSRVDPLDLSDLPEAVRARTSEAFGEGVSPAESVVRMLQDVRTEGDDAVRRYARLLDGVELEDLRVGQDEIDQAYRSISTGLRESLELAAQRVRDFHQAVMPKDWMDEAQGLGQVRPAQ